MAHEIGSSDTPRTFESIREGNTLSPKLTRTGSNSSQPRRSISRSNTQLSHKETHRDPNLDPNLPYRTYTENANLEEYTTEKPEGEVDGGRRPDGNHYKLITFLPDDPENPKNWSKGFKWYVTMVVAITCFVVAFASSVITADIAGVVKEFNVSDEVALLPVTLFVVGFGIGMIAPPTRSLLCLTATGPMVFAPMSEVLGRRVIYGSTLLLAVIFIIPSAVSTNIETLIICRAIDGIAFSAPMTLVGGTLADMWRTEERGVPMAAFSAAPVCSYPLSAVIFAAKLTQICSFLDLQ